jgi:hypothetical protein
VLLPTPTVRLVIAAGVKFQRQNAVTESAVTQLFQAFPQNTDLPHILLKVLVLNKLYSTQIRDIDIETVARHIASLGIDSLLSTGSAQAVTLIAKVDINKKQRNNFSFATKYCSWHNPASYAIYDSNVDECLWSYKKQNAFANFYRKDLREYEKFLGVVTAFRGIYCLTSLSFKQLDKFLWLQGIKLKGRRV